MKSKNIQHLFWRAGFGLSPSQWQKRQYWSIPKAINYLFQEAKAHTAKIAKQSGEFEGKEANELSKKEKAEKRKEQRRLVGLQNVDWLLEMGKGQQSDLLHKMSLFWHGHFACTSKVGILAANQLLTLQKHALGSFRDLVIAIAKDPAMIRYLNNQQNRKSSPNENFARELMELFTIGRGNYTEQDIKEAARAFTGWSSNFGGEYIFRRRHHDYGQKLFMGKRGNFDGVDIIDIILERKETAVFICRKVYRYFVNPKVNESIVQQLATIFYQSNYDIALLMRTIFESDWFYAHENHKIKIKSPTEFLAGMVRQLDLQVQNRLALFGIQRALGQILFNPPNVAGWAGGKSWIDNATLMLRLNLPQAIFTASAINMRSKDDLEGKGNLKKLKRLNASANLQPLFQNLSLTSKEEVLDQLSQYLIASSVTQHIDILKNFTSKKSSEDFVKSLTMRLMMLPEYQLC